MRPIYTPSTKIVNGFTSGQEYVLSEDKREYIGPYHIYPNGAIYTGSKPSKYSKELLQYTSVYNLPNTSRYAQITDRQYNNHTSPKYFYPAPSIDDYSNGFIERYLVQKKNDIDLIYEISEKDFRDINTSNNRGINGNLYNDIRLKWLLTGPREDVYNTNRRVVMMHETRMPGILRYLSNFIEFYK